MDATTPKILRKLADDCWNKRRRGDRGSSPDSDTIIGALPVGGAQILEVSRRCRPGRVATVSFRHWLIAPDGSRLPTRWGLNIAANALAQFAGIVAIALQLEIDDLERSDDRTESRNARAPLREAPQIGWGDDVADRRRRG